MVVRLFQQRRLLSRCPGEAGSHERGTRTVHQYMSHMCSHAQFEALHVSFSLPLERGMDLVYTEHFVARIFLMRTVCQEVLSGSHPSLTFHALAWLKMKLCAFSKTVHTSRNMSYTTPELTSTFSPCTRTPSYPSARPTSTSSTFHSSEINPYLNHNQRVSARWLMYAPLQVMSPRILQKTRTHVSRRCSSTDRV